MNATINPLAERVVDRIVDSCRVISLDTPIDDVVSWEGSFKTYPDLASGQSLVQTLVVSLLDKGTRSRDRFAIAEILENKGAQVQFSSDGRYVTVSGRALREDIPDILPLIAEQLIEPLFDPEEFEKARARVAAALHRSLENTASQAAGALSRRLYSFKHHNFIEMAEEQLKQLQSLTVEDVRTFHDMHFGANDLTMVLVGDVDHSTVDQVVQSHFGAWPQNRAPFMADKNATSTEPGRTEIVMSDKHNIDVRIGHSLSLLRGDDDYIPLYLGNYILGGNFSARLMTKIRDEMGLTYGIRSGLTGIAIDHDGHWQVSVTLSKENLNQGISATLDEIRKFVDEGVTEDELSDKKTTVNGRYVVGLATTDGMASVLLHNAERGFGTEYLDSYPEKIEETQLSTVNAVIQRHCTPDQLHLALAGSLEI